MLKSLFINNTEEYFRNNSRNYKYLNIKKKNIFRNEKYLNNNVECCGLFDAEVIQF